MNIDIIDICFIFVIFVILSISGYFIYNSINKNNSKPIDPSATTPLTSTTTPPIGTSITTPSTSATTPPIGSNTSSTTPPVSPNCNIDYCNSTMQDYINKNWAFDNSADQFVNCKNCPPRWYRWLYSVSIDGTKFTDYNNVNDAYNAIKL